MLHPDQSCSSFQGFQSQHFSEEPMRTKHHPWDVLTICKIIFLFWRLFLCKFYKNLASKFPGFKVEEKRVKIRIVLEIVRMFLLYFFALHRLKCRILLHIYINDVSGRTKKKFGFYRNVTGRIYFILKTIQEN